MIAYETWRPVFLIVFRAKFWGDDWRGREIWYNYDKLQEWTGCFEGRFLVFWDGT